MDCYHSPKSSNSLEDPPKVPSRTNSAKSQDLVIRRLLEPRDSIYVYDFSSNKTVKMRTTELGRMCKDNYDQVEIPLRLGRIPIQIRDEEYDGPKSIVACVHVSMKLRLDRWLGRQKVLYIVDAGIDHE